MFLSLPQVHKYGEKAAPSNPPLLPFLDFKVQSCIFLCLNFLFALDLRFIAVAQSGYGISVTQVFASNSKRYLFESAPGSSALKLPLSASFSTRKGV